MQGLEKKARDYIEKLKITTKRFMNAPDNIKLPNNWGKREVAIHFNGWDEIIIQWAEEIKKGRILEWDEFYTGDHNEDNKKFLEETKGIKTTEIIERFNKSRLTLIAIYEDILENYFVEDEKILEFFSLFGHDVYHLKQAGIKIDDLT